MKSMVQVAVFLGCMVLGYAVSAAQEKPDVPTLSTEQRQAIQIKAQEMEIAQLRFDKARGELTALLKSFDKDGYDIDLQTMTYVKKPKK